MKRELEQGIVDECRCKYGLTIRRLSFVFEVGDDYLEERFEAA
jgi:hypothetical protein